MPSLASASDPRVYHQLVYGTLLGSNLFQTFLAGPIGFKALPRPSFATLQTAILPPYFLLQTALPLVLVATWPGQSGWRGLLQQDNMQTGLLPLAIMVSTSLLNLTVLGPLTTKTMKERKHQETRDGKRYYDPGPKSPEMVRLNSRFSRLHGASSLSSLIGTFALLFYGAVLAEKS